VDPLIKSQPKITSRRALTPNVHFWRNPDMSLSSVLLYPPIGLVLRVGATNETEYPFAGVKWTSSVTHFTMSKARFVVDFRIKDIACVRG